MLEHVITEDRVELLIDRCEKILGRTDENFVVRQLAIPPPLD